MSKLYDVAVVGGHGLVSKNIVADLYKYEFPIGKLTVYGSKEHATMPLVVHDHSIDVDVINEDDIKHHDIVFFSGTDDLPSRFADLFVKKGAKVIDNSSFFRMYKNVPLVIPEVNPFDLLNDTEIYATPNCTTTMMVAALYPLHKYFTIERINVATYQSASGAGRQALEEMINERFNPNFKPKVLPSRNVKKKRLHENILPIVDDIDEATHYTNEEIKMRLETQKILHDDQIEVNATCVRIPTIVGHGAAVSIICKEIINLEVARKLLLECPWLRIKENDDYPDLLGVVETPFVDVGRLRIDPDCEYTLNLFVTSDNLVRGASYTAVMLALKLIELKII